MHRSGTSAATRLINLLGADISQDLLRPLPDNNEKGFWESKALMVTHDRLLEALNSSWDGLLPLPAGWIATSAAQEARLTISKELDRLAGGALFVVKDPRLPRLLPLWLNLLDERGIEPVVVIPYRNPLEVALSLKRRDGFPISKSMLIFARSNLDAELASRGRKRLFVNYATLLGDWRAFAKRLRDVAGPAIKQPRGQRIAEIENFLTSDLYHNRVTREELVRHPETGATVVTIYDCLDRAAAGGSDASLRRSFDRLRDTVQEATKLFGNLVTPKPPQEEAAAPPPSNKTPAPPPKPPGPAQSPVKGPASGDQNRALELMAEARADLARRLDEMSKKVASLDETRLGLVKQLGQAEAQKAELKAQRAEARMQQQAAEIAALTKDLEAWKKRAQNQASQIEALTQQTGRIAVLSKELEAARASETQLRAEYGEVAGKLQDARATLSAELEKLRGEADQDKARLESQGAKIEALTRELEAALSSSADFLATRDRLKRERVEMQIRAQKSETKLQQAEIRAQQQASKVEALNQQLHQALAKNSELAAANEALGKYVTALRGNMTELLVAREVLRRQRSEARAEAQRLALAARAAEARAEALASELEGATARDSDLEAMKAQFSRQIDEAQSGVRKFAARLQAAETRAQQRETQVETLTRKAQALALQHEAQVESLSKEIDGLRAELAKAPLEREREIEAVRSQLSQVIVARERDLQTLRADLERLAAERDLELQALQGAWNQAVAERDGHIQALRSDLAQAALQHDRMVRSLTESASWRIAAPVRKAENWISDRRRRREMDLILRSGLFDQDWYLEQYPDVADSGLDPLEHFLRWGADEGRNPGPDFDTQWYLANHADVRTAGVNPLLHFVTKGAAEGRQCRPAEPTEAEAHSATDTATGIDGGSVEPVPSEDLEPAEPAAPFRLVASSEAEAGDFGPQDAGAPPPDDAAAEEELDRQAELISQSGLFDAAWYLKQYPDVAASAYSPLFHFLRWGAAEGRNPGPNFDSAQYLAANPDAAETDTNPLLHYLLRGFERGPPPKVKPARSPRFEFKGPLPPAARPRHPQALPADALKSHAAGLLRAVPDSTSAGAGEIPVSFPGTAGEPTAPAVEHIQGDLGRKDRQPTVLVCAHAAGTGIYGSERSLLDLLDGFEALGYNAIVTVPKRKNHLYIEEIKKRSLGVYFSRYDWWTKAPPAQDAIETFEDIIAVEAVDVVHTNTIMLREPLIAARRTNIKSIVHAREVINFDAPLCEYIGQGSREIVASVLESADHVIANSVATARCFGISDDRFVVPNCIDVDLFDVANDVDPGDIKVALISSNLPKKGIFDLVDIARQLSDLPAKFLLIGPDNEFVAQLKSAEAVGALPKNLQLAGYSSSPVEAVAQANIVVNLSHFQESFGRSVLEALAARRPVVAYDWGAVSELVVDGQNGFLVPFLDTEQAASRLRYLCENPALITSFGEAGRAGAVAKYGKDAFAAKMRQVYALILGTRTAEPPTEAPDKGIPRVSVIIPNFNYERHLPARIESIARQTVRPAEIIFLDDVSTDDSVAVARELLEKTGIPCRMIVNEANRGTYRQWLTGIEAATGDFIWIAEADDDCEPEFLATLLEQFDDPSVAIAYAQSRRIDEDGRVTAATNLQHTDDVSKAKWLDDYVELGTRETVDALAFRNTIPNVSACVFRKDALLAAGPSFAELQSCGDWLLYAQILRQAKIAYVAKPLNAFRRHGGSSTRKRERSPAFLDELLRVREFICANFPIHQRQLPLLNRFLDKDYRIEGVAKPSESPGFADLETRLSALASRRRIGFITTNNGSSFGGSEVLWQEAALRLAGAGHDVAVLIKEWSPRPDFFDALEKAGIALHFKERDGLERLIAFAPDLTVVSLGDQDEGTDYFRRLQDEKLPYVIVNQLTKEERFWPIRANKAADVKAGYLGAERVFFTCRNNHRVMEERLSCSLPNWDVHYNPFHIDRNFVPPFPPRDQGLQLALPAKLLFIHKGQDILVEVLKDEKWKSRNLVINIYGIGPDRDRLEQMAREYGVRNLVFHGRVADIGEIWKNNHALVLPSRMEGMPIMLISALLSARVPIVTDIGGHAEVVDDGVTGFIAANPSVEALDQALERAYAAKEDWEEIGRRARDRVLAYLPDDPVADFIAKILPLAGSAGSAESTGRDVKQTAPI